MLRDRFDVDLGLDWSAEELAERIGDLRRHPHPLGDQADRRPDRPRRPHEGHRARRRGGRQRRRRGRHAPRHHRRQRAGLERHHRRRAHRGAAAGAGPQRPAGPQGADRGQLGAVQVGRGRGLREDARAARLRPHRPARRSARAGLRDARDGLRPVRLRPALPRAGRRPGRHLRPALRRVGLHLHPPAQDARDARLARRRGAGQVPRRRADRQLRARRAGGRRRAQGGARLRQGRGGRARRVHPGAGHRPSALRLFQRGRHPAPGRLHDRGPGPRGRADRRAGGRRAHRRRGLDRRQHPGGQRRGHGGAGAVPAPGQRPRPGGDGARRVHQRRPRRARVPGPDRRARHAPADPLGAERPAVRPHRRGGQPRQRAVAGRSSAGSRSPSARSRSRATSQTSCA